MPFHPVETLIEAIRCDDDNCDDDDDDDGGAGEDEGVLPLKSWYHSRHYDDADDQQLAEGEEDLNPSCPCHAHTVQVHNRSYRDRERGTGIRLLFNNFIAHNLCSVSTFSANAASSVSFLGANQS